jgi:hypothetical protein
MAIAGPNQTDLSALRIDDRKRRPRSVVGVDCLKRH